MNNESLTNSRLYGLLPSAAEGMEELTRLALDLWWSWNRSTDALWEELSPRLWQATHNPWLILQTVSRDQLETKLKDPGFREKMNALLRKKQEAASNGRWFDREHPGSPLTCVAYFSMEFMLHEALPIYVGGLGNVAGDQLKSASDLGVPVVGVGLLYQQGYFRQEIDQDGNQQAFFPYNDPGQLPVTPLRLPNGEWLRLEISLAGHPVWLRTWQVQVGEVKLYLLDSNDMVNLPAHREITNVLYGGGPETRIMQEIVLGMGGWQLLRAIGVQPEVCHLNEGHAAFLILERARSFMAENGVSFQAALAVTRAGNLFTTHTAVAAGFDHFSPSLMGQFFGAYAKNELGIGLDELMALGRTDPSNAAEYFNMAFLAVRGSGAVNGVSRLHGQVSRQLFSVLFPRQPLDEIPVGYVTNGVHMPSWDNEFADKVWTEACGMERWKGDLENMEYDISRVPDQALWQMRNDSRNKLVNYTRERFGKQLRNANQPPERVAGAGQVFNPGALTLGFARRFVPYKRPDLLLHDPERFVRILTHPQRPVQLVIAGKVPPFDEAGKRLVRQWIEFIGQHNLQRHVVFLSDYDVSLAGQLVQGVDVWINTPRRPWEASGTSGMKVLVNGGLNLSELDGWWAEAYTPEVGWAIGDGQEHGEDAAWDAAEARALYDLLENQVVPGFYDRNPQGIPEGWVARMRKSMATLTPRFSANRTIRQYAEQYYLPAAAHYRHRAAQHGAEGTHIVQFRHELLQKWEQVQFGEVQATEVENRKVFRVEVKLNGIDPGNVRVELYADGINGTAPEKIEMKPVAAAEVSAYEAEVNGSRPAGDYTARLLPRYEGIAVPLEDNLIRWQR